MSQMQIFQGVEFIIENNQVLISETNLAKTLQYARLRTLRQLIDRHDSILEGIRQRRVVQRYESRQGVWQTREISEYLMTEAQALYITAKSSTLRANELTKKIISGFLEARAYIIHLLTAPMDAVMKELTEARVVFKEENERLIKENESLKSALRAPLHTVTAVNLEGLKPGERAMVTKIIDTTDAMYLRQVNEEFGFPTRGKHSRMLVSISQKLNVWGVESFFVAIPIDLSNGTRLKNQAKMWLPTARSVISHTAIRRARKLGYAVPFNTLMKYGDPDAPKLSPNPQGVLFQDGVPVLHPVKKKPEKA